MLLDVFDVVFQDQLPGCLGQINKLASAFCGKQNS